VRLKGRLRARHGDRVACGCPGGTYLLAVSQDFCWHDDGEPHPMLAAMREAEAKEAKIAECAGRLERIKAGVADTPSGGGFCLECWLKAAARRRSLVSMGA
jgi:hypothetical protein